MSDPTKDQEAAAPAQAPHHEPPAPPEAPPPRSEADSPRTMAIFLLVLGGTFVLTGIVLGLNQYFEISVREEIEAKLLRPESEQLRRLRADEEARLSRYQWIDQARGVVRIPVDRARELVVAEWAGRPDGFAGGTGGEAPPPSAGQPPSPATPPPAGAGPGEAR